MTSLTLIRGLPGSGKSTLAKNLDVAIRLEADQFFIVLDKYVFDVNKLHAAHEWCQTNTDNCLGNGFSVVVSNTFTTKKELLPYFEIAKKHGIIPNVITCNGEFGSIHNVPEETMNKMRQRFDYHCVEQLYKEFSV